eukprot:6288685-Alexandrium_andersonii.AAC.1
MVTDAREERLLVSMTEGGMSREQHSPVTCDFQWRGDSSKRPGLMVTDAREERQLVAMTEGGMSRE